MAGNEKKLNSFSKKAEEFLKSECYDSLSTPEKLDETFIKALKLFLSSHEDSIILGCIAEEFENNPSIHLSKFQKEIYEAVELPYYYLFKHELEIDKTTRFLKDFYLGYNKP